MTELLSMNTVRTAMNSIRYPIRAEETQKQSELIHIAPKTARLHKYKGQCLQRANGPAVDAARIQQSFKLLDCKELNYQILCKENIRS